MRGRWYLTSPVNLAIALMCFSLVSMDGTSSWRVWDMILGMINTMYAFKKEEDGSTN